MSGHGDAPKLNMLEAQKTFAILRRTVAARRFVLAGALLSLAACEGDNAFGGDSEFAVPRLALYGPEVVVARDTFQVRIDAIAARGVGRIDVALRGAVNIDTTYTSATASQNISQVFRFAAPDAFLDTVVVIMARVVDKAGASSQAVADTAMAFGPPVVLSLQGPDSVRPGTTVSFRMRVAGARPINRIDLTIRGAMTRDTSILVLPPSIDVTQDLSLTIPQVVNDTLVRIGITPRDQNGFATSVLVHVPIAASPPMVTFTAPATAVPDTLIKLEVHASGTRQISMLRFELDGAVDSTVTVPVNPPANDIRRDVYLRLPGNILDETLIIRAYAQDRSGMWSQPTISTVQMLLPPPEILEVSLLRNVVAPGDKLDVRVRARGSRALNRINVWVRGANADADVAQPIGDGTVKDVTVDAVVPIPTKAVTGGIIVYVTATDSRGAVSQISSAAAQVAGAVIVDSMVVNRPSVTRRNQPGIRSLPDRR